MRGRIACVGIAALMVGLTGAASTDNAARVYDAMNIKAGQVLAGSVLLARVVPGESKQLVAAVTYMTGKKDTANAVNVRLEIFATAGETLTSIYARDFGEENGGYVGRGELEIVDLDGDGVNEIIVTYDNYRDTLIKERRGEVLFHGAGGFEKVWDGSVKYDATRAARSVPAERRDRYKREVDVVETLRTKGDALVMKKTMIAVAGERLAEPKVILESYPLGAETR